MNKTMTRLFAVLLCMLCVFASAAQAATVTKDGLQATLTTDKKAYQAGEQIRVSLTVKNTGEKEMKPVSVSYTLPQMCLSTAAGQQTRSLAGGESVTLSSTITVATVREMHMRLLEYRPAASSPSSRLILLYIGKYAVDKEWPIK